MKIKDKIVAKIPEEKRPKIKKTLNVLRVIKNIVCWTLIVVLAFSVITFLLTRFTGGTPSLFGYTIQRVVSGSMEPELHVGDVILGKKVDDIGAVEEGDVITFQGGESFSFQRVTHRVVVAPHVENGEIILTTKGDANNVADSPITADRVESKFVRKLSFLATLYTLFLSPWGLIIFIGLLLLVFFDELLNIIRIATGNYPEEKEESIAEIMERIQREDAEKEEEKKRRALKNSQDMVQIMAQSETESKTEENSDEASGK